MSQGTTTTSASACTTPRPQVITKVPNKKRAPKGKAKRNKPVHPGTGHPRSPAAPAKRKPPKPDDDLTDYSGPHFGGGGVAADLPGPKAEGEDDITDFSGPQAKEDD